MEIGEAIAALFGLDKNDPAEKLKPKITVAKWSRPWVAPIQNSTFPPGSPPTDTTIPVWCKVSLHVYTNNVPDGTKVTITVHHCHSGAMVKDGKIENLKVLAGGVVDNSDTPPEFTFEAKHQPWDPWDKPFFYFKVQVEYQGLKAETSTDYDNEEDVLRVLYQHICISDAIADTPAGGGLTTAAEMNEIAGILRTTNHRVNTQAFNQASVPVALWGSVIRNTYAYHHASHGDIVDRATSAQLNVPDNPPTAPPGSGPWRSVVVLGSTNLGDTEVNQTGNVPSVPRYLVYMDTCVAGWEASLGRAFISRGTQSYLAFRMYIPDGDARTMARNFYKSWATKYRCNPARIANVFWDVGAPFFGSMRPLLMGSGGGEIHDSSIRNALKEAMTGFASHF